MTKQLPRGVRVNNPGNIDKGDPWLGLSADQSADPRFCVFDTPESGIRAIMRLLITYQTKHKLCTIREVIHRWAPPKENNTGAYVQHVARLTGFDPDEQLSFLDREVNLAMTKAIIRHENGPPSQYGKPEDWYPQDVFDRAAVRAGFEPGVSPMKKSRTVQGGVVAAAGVAIGAVTAAPVMEAAVTAVSPDNISALVTIIGTIVGPAATPYVGPMIALIGLGRMLYARWDDARRKLR